MNVIIDVASALEYLHRSYSIPVVHCDLKPNNVLLNEDMVACVTNFGVPKILSILHQYGSEGLVSTGSDIYSYGSMLIEVFARLKPIDEMFSDTRLRNWVKSYVPTANCIGGHNVYCENSYSLHRRFSQGQDECYRCSCFSRIARQPRKLFTQNKEIHILEIDFMSILRN
ncbi:unnamed protein product [Coffea canephora]|uniref:Protein kinase domain-containing protein n=1 Tax=Coffea canephora TaxID=49390 RepID=A0A068UWP4_COFCA|nr:unnamed protein product [Coffea canephora]